jgi:proline iminopeptidase
MPLFDPIEPFAFGMLAVGDGNELYWETSGNPDGKPAVMLHGGPGGGMKTGYRRRFDPATHLIIGFEQRGCGRSRPLATDDLRMLATNTTQHLISDMELLREHLGVQRWLVSGVSWGSTLALAYSEAHPERVSELALLAVTTTSRFEVDWITETVGAIFPEAWDAAYRASGARVGERMVEAFRDRLQDTDARIREQAAADWMAWEDAHVSLGHGYGAGPTMDPVERQVFATLVTHYWANDGFLGGDGVMANIASIADIPGVLVHGRMDVSGPAVTAWRLHEAWPASRLVIVEDEGHGGDRMIEALVTAIDGFARD